MRGYSVRGKAWKALVLGMLLLAILVVPALFVEWPAFAASEQKPPVKIGILYPFTGPYTYGGKRMLRGWEVYLESIDYKVAGRPIKLIVEDTKGDPNICVTKTSKLIEQDQVHILAGVGTSAEAYAIRDTIDRREIPLVITLANAGDLTREKRSPYIFRTFVPGGTPSYYMAQFLATDLKLKRAIVSVPDYAYGREHAEMFKKEFERLGGQVVFENFTPLGVPDFGPYCINIAKMAGKADVLHFVYSSAEAIRFVKAANDFGLKNRFTLSCWGATPDGPSLDQMGAGAEGIYSASIAYYATKSEANRRFLDLDKKKGGAPDAHDYYGYLGAEVIVDALKQVQGNVEEKAQFLKALREVKFEAVSGPFRFDPRSQNALHNLQIGKVQRADWEFGKYQNVLIKTIPQAQDPWWLGR